MTELDPTPNIVNKWNTPFHLEYLVTMSNHELGTKLHVTNPATANSVLKHQALLHNYIAAPASKVTITPLTGLKYKDKIQGGIEVVEERQEVDVISATDSVYPSAPGTYDVRWPGTGLNIKTTGFPDVVIWNPNEEIGKGIKDLEERGWYVPIYIVILTAYQPLWKGKICMRGTGARFFLERALSGKDMAGNPTFHTTMTLCTQQIIGPRNRISVMYLTMIKLQPCILINKPRA